MYRSCSVSDPPIVQMTSLDLEPTQVTVTWTLLAGQMAVLELRYNSFTEDPPTTDIDVSDWTVLRNMTHEETNVVVYYEFKMNMYNVFALIPFEDTELQTEGRTTGYVPRVVAPPEHSKT